MQNFNFSVIEGNLVEDPTVMQVKGDRKLCKFTIGNSRDFTKANGESVRDANFIPVTTWAKLAENCGRYLKKGSRVLVSGVLKQDSYTDKEGRSRKAFFIDGKEVNFLSSKPRQAEGDSQRAF
jgi:single-strand DNA-binding protein